eukprot:56099-Lingulodinium_polyedra.AAC.1
MATDQVVQLAVVMMMLMVMATVLVMFCGGGDVCDGEGDGEGNGDVRRKGESIQDKRDRELENKICFDIIRSRS